MKKKIIFYFLFLVVVTGCAGEQVKSKNTASSGRVQNSQVEEKPAKQKSVEEGVTQKENEPKSKQTLDQKETVALKTDNQVEPKQENEKVQLSNQSKLEKETLSNDLSWEGFFDNGDQTTPSEKFWDLKGQQVTIDGFMGEVLSLNGGWFLLIPAPGAECPFDNGDESYWNKIMIVFVKDKKELRFTSGPLQLTGRLDVGIKVDESNYKTMFRLYDATFEKMK